MVDNMFVLELKNLGPYGLSHRIKTENSFIEVRELTAAGKTTIARILHAFVTGRMDTSLLKIGAEEGYAKLILNNKEYNLVIKQSSAKLDKVMDAAYSEYLVLTEGTPLYSFYVSPPKQVDIEELAKRFVPQPPELARLEAELKKFEPKSYDAEKLITSYQASLEEKQKELERIEAEIKKVDDELTKAIDMNKIKPVFEKQKLQDQIKILEEEIKKMQDEYTKLLTEIQHVNYDEVKNRHKQLIDDVERLYRRRDTIETALNNLEKIRGALSDIRNVVDVLIDYNIVLFGQFVDPQTVEAWLSDAEEGVKTLTSKKSEIKVEISKLEQEKNRLESALEEYVKKYQRMTDLETAVNRRTRELRDAKIKLSYLELQVKELEGELGMSEDEILKKATEAVNADVLLNKKKELERRAEEVRRLIKDIEVAIEKVKQKQEEVAENGRVFEELKKKVNTLKNEWAEKKKVFKDTFKEAYKEVFKNITIPDFNPESMTISRPPHTYSQGERLLMTIAYQYALLSAMKVIGYDIPLIVIDLIVPIDEKYESEIKRVYKNLDTFRMILKTSNEPSIQAVF